MLAVSANCLEAVSTAQEHTLAALQSAPVLLQLTDPVQVAAASTSPQLQRDSNKSSKNRSKYGLTPMKVRCPECRKWLAPNSVNRHFKNLHPNIRVPTELAAARTAYKNTLDRLKQQQQVFVSVCLFYVSCLAVYLPAASLTDRACRRQQGHPQRHVHHRPTTRPASSSSSSSNCSMQLTTK